jgi:hypothetical protein
MIATTSIIISDKLNDTYQWQRDMKIHQVFQWYQKLYCNLLRSMQELHSVPVQFCLVLEKEAEEEGGGGEWV